jgi:hypothetical protein
MRARATLINVIHAQMEKTIVCTRLIMCKKG